MRRKKSAKRGLPCFPSPAGIELNLPVYVRRGDAAAGAVAGNNLLTFRKDFVAKEEQLRLKEGGTESWRTVRPIKVVDSLERDC